MSEFGKGYAYCLGLFLAHEWRIYEGTQQSTSPDRWFNGAADHLYDLQIPYALPEDKRREIGEWRDKCIAFRLCMDGEQCTWHDAKAATQKAKDFLREWDQFHGIASEQGRWE